MCAAHIMPQGTSCPQDASYPDRDTSFFTVVKQRLKTPVIKTLALCCEKTRRELLGRVVGNAGAAFAVESAGCRAGTGGFVNTFAGHNFSSKQ